MKKQATEKQINFLKKLGVEPASDITVSEASRMIQIALAKKCNDFIRQFNIGEEVFHRVHKVRCQIEKIRPVADARHRERNHFTVVFPDGKRRAVSAHVVKKIRKL